MKKLASEDQEEQKDVPEDFAAKHVAIFEPQSPEAPLDVYLYNEIAESYRYVELCQTLRNSPKGRSIRLHINSPGGLVSTGTALISAMLQSKAHIQARVEGEASSMAAYIALAADSLVFGCPATEMMLHTSWHEISGKVSDTSSTTLATAASTRSLIEQLTIPFLLKKEADAILRGEDFYLTHDGAYLGSRRIESPTLADRIIKHNEFRRKQTLRSMYGEVL